MGQSRVGEARNYFNLIRLTMLEMQEANTSTGMSPDSI